MLSLGLCDLKGYVSSITAYKLQRILKKNCREIVLSILFDTFINIKRVCIFNVMYT